MGEVYKARDERLKRDVAIKVLPASFSNDPDRLRRFEQEAQAAGSLNHPNLTAVYDVGSHDGAPYVVQELLEGETLRTLLSGGRLSQRRAVDYAIQIARGLSAAHEKGIVHRDLKPENVFVTNDGRVKILDFGLAKLTHQEATGQATNLPTASVGTEPGVVLGTLGYMSPEQVRGRPADARSDIFSFGAILYEMLSGKRAFHGDSAADTMSAILREDPPELSVTGGGISPALERIVRHCIEKSPERRLHSAHDLSFELESLTQTTGQAAALPASRAPRVLRWAVPAAVAAAIAAAAFLIGRAGSRLKSNGWSPSFRQLTNLAGSEYEPALSRDGQNLLFVKRNGSKTDIWALRSGGRKPISLTPDCDSDSDSPAFSPDGNLIAYRSGCGGGGLFLMGATGENVRRLTSFGGDPAWSPDGKEIVFTTEIGWSPYGRATTSQLWAVDVASGKTRELFAGDAVQASVSPHGKRIAFWALPPGGSQRDIWTIPYKGLARGEKPVPVTQDPAVDWNPVWSPDGRFLHFLSNRDGVMNLWRVAIDEATGRPLGAPEPQTLPAREVDGFALAGDGRHLAYVDDEHTYSIERLAFDPSSGQTSGGPVEVFQTSLNISNPAVSRDGSLITLTGASPQEDIYLMRSDGTGLRQLTDDAPRDRNSGFSPDGGRVVFQSDRSGSWELWTISTDGSGLTQLTRTGQSPFIPEWSPDGRRIAASTGDGVLVFDLDEKGGVSRTTHLPPGPGGLVPQVGGWTQDGGELLLFLSQRGLSSGDVARFSLDSQKYEILPARGFTRSTPEEAVSFSPILRPALHAIRGREGGPRALSPAHRSQRRHLAG
jgi:serine/threonine protein kinase